MTARKMTWVGIAKKSSMPFRQRVLQIGNPDLADDGVSRALARTGRHMDIWHDPDFPRPFFDGREARADPMFLFLARVTRVPRPTKL
jgi:hypothetical protein